MILIKLIFKILVTLIKVAFGLLTFCASVAIAAGTAEELENEG